MNYLKKALESCGVRLSYEDKWLIINVSTNEYEIWQRKYGEKISKLLLITNEEEIAVKKLLTNNE